MSLGYRGCRFQTVKSEVQAVGGSKGWREAEVLKGFVQDAMVGSKGLSEAEVIEFPKQPEVELQVTQYVNLGREEKEPRDCGTQTELTLDITAVQTEETLVQQLRSPSARLSAE